MAKLGVYDDEQPEVKKELVEFEVHCAAVDFESDDYEDPKFKREVERQEAARLMALVENSFPLPIKTTSIDDMDAILEAKRRHKYLLKDLKTIHNLRYLHDSGRELNEEQCAKVICEEELLGELKR